MSPPTPASATAARPRRRWSRLLGWVVSVAILAATVALLRDRFADVGEAGGLPGVAPSALAAGLFLLGNAVIADTWRRIVALAGVPLPRRTAFWIWSVSQLARYTLGAAQVGGRAVMGRRHGLTAMAGTVTALVEIGWLVSLTAAIALLTIPWWLPGAEELTWLAWSGVVPALVLVIGLLAPRTLLRAIVAVLRIGPLRRLVGARADRAVERVAISRRSAAGLTLRFAVNNGLRILGFFALLAGVTGSARAGDLLLAAGALSIGQLVGWLAVFVPGGIGPREGATALVLAPVVGGGAALVLVAAVRLLEVLAEVGFLGVAALLRPRVDAV